MTALRASFLAKQSLAALLATLTLWGTAFAANPVDLRNARNEVARIHRSTIQQVATIVGVPEEFVKAYVVNQPEAGRMSASVDLTSEQHRQLKRLVGEQNLRARSL